MRRIILVTFMCCGLAWLGAPMGPAQAADYAGGPGYRHAWRGTRTVLRFEPRVRYLRLVEQLPFCAYCDNPPTRYLPDPYWSPIYVAEPVCASRRVRVIDGRGGWSWGVQTTCY